MTTLTRRAREEVDRMLAGMTPDPRWRTGPPLTIDGHPVEYAQWAVWNGCAVRIAHVYSLTERVDVFDDRTEEIVGRGLPVRSLKFYGSGFRAYAAERMIRRHAQRNAKS